MSQGPQQYNKTERKRNRQAKALAKREKRLEQHQQKREAAAQQRTNKG